MTTGPPARDDAPSDPVAVDNHEAATEPPLTEEERSELTWLRTENTLLRVERDILMRVASGYAKDMDTLLDRRPPRSAS